MQSNDDIDFVVPLSREIAYDLLPAEQVQNFLSVLNLSPESPEVAEKESYESYRRLQETEPYLDFIEIYSAILASTFGIVLESRMVEPMTDEERQNFISERQQIIALSTHVILAHMLRAGVINHGSWEE